MNTLITTTLAVALSVALALASSLIYVQDYSEHNGAIVVTIAALLYLPMYVTVSHLRKDRYIHTVIRNRWNA